MKGRGIYILLTVIAATMAVLAASCNDDDEYYQKALACASEEGSRELHGYQTFRVNRIGCRLP